MTTIDVSGAATVGYLVADACNVDLAVGALLMCITKAQAIMHTGDGGGDFSLVSTNGNVTIDDGDVTGVATIDVRGSATVGNLVADNGSAELAAGNVALAVGALLITRTLAQEHAHWSR